MKNTILKTGFVVSTFIWMAAAGFGKVDFNQPETLGHFGYKSADEMRLVRLVEGWDWSFKDFSEADKIALLERLLERTDVNLHDKYGRKLGFLAKNNPTLRAFIEAHPLYQPDYTFFEAQEAKGLVIVLQGNDSSGAFGGSHDEQSEALIGNEMNMDLLSFDTRDVAISLERMGDVIRQYNTKGLPVTVWIKAHGSLNVSTGRHTLWINGASLPTIEVIRFLTQTLGGQPYDLIMTACQSGGIIKLIDKTVMPEDSRMLVFSEYKDFLERMPLGASEIMMHDIVTSTPSHLLPEVIVYLAKHQLGGESLMDAIQTWLLANSYGHRKDWADYPSYLKVGGASVPLYPQTYINYFRQHLRALPIEAKDMIFSHLESMMASWVNLEVSPEIFSIAPGELFGVNFEDESLDGELEVSVAFGFQNIFSNTRGLYNVSRFKANALAEIQKFFDTGVISTKLGSGVFASMYEYVLSAEFGEAYPEIRQAVLELKDPKNWLDNRLFESNEA